MPRGPSFSGAYYIRDGLPELVGLDLGIVGRQTEGKCSFRQFYRTHAHRTSRKFGDGVVTVIVSIRSLPFAISDCGLNGESFLRGPQTGGLNSRTRCSLR
jgi:hypothetical protein